MTRHAALRAANRTIYRPVGPIAYDFVKLVIVRDGSAILFSEGGEHPINVGDVVLLAANTLCGSEPEGHITDRKSTRLNSSHVAISYAVFCFKKKNRIITTVDSDKR